MMTTCVTCADVGVRGKHAAATGVRLCVCVCVCACVCCVCVCLTCLMYLASAVAWCVCLLHNAWRTASPGTSVPVFRARAFACPAYQVHGDGKARQHDVGQLKVITLPCHTSFFLQVSDEAPFICMFCRRCLMHWTRMGTDLCS